MRKLVLFLASAALVAFTASCGVFRSYSSRMADIHPGMTPSEVTGVFGNPDMRGFEGDKENWKYYYYVSDDKRSYVLIEIVFVDGKVYSMDSHRVDTPYAPPGGVPHPGHDRPGPPHPGTGIHAELHAGSE